MDIVEVQLWVVRISIVSSALVSFVFLVRAIVFSLIQGAKFRIPGKSLIPVVIGLTLIFSTLNVWWWYLAITYVF